jgi:signal transduction histidine kinase
MILEWLYNQKNIFLTFIVVSVLLISYLHYSTIPQIHDLHNIFAELYYLPLMIGAFVFGLRGAVITFIFVSILYIPHIIINWTGTFSFAANKLLHALISGLFAFLAGFLVDREKKIREQAEKDRYLAGLGQAAAAIVHDLKNPLISILGFARRLSKGKGDVAAATDIIISSAENMQLIVHDVLDFAKPVRMDLKAQDAGNIVRRACSSCGVKADEEGVVLSIALPSEPVNLSIDSLHLERALINLINNAVEASNKDDMVKVHAALKDGRMIISIKDSGEGMDSETVENVFIPFYTKKNSGTGLGMAIAKKVVEGHHGTIDVNSFKGAGTEIIIELPM